MAAELTRRGYVASLTLRNTKGIDVLASNADATRTVGIQVKTSQGRRAEWMLNRKAEADLAENLFYVFVCLTERDLPLFFVQGGAGLSGAGQGASCSARSARPWDMVLAPPPRPQACATRHASPRVATFQHVCPAPVAHPTPRPPTLPPGGCLPPQARD